VVKAERHPPCPSHSVKAKSFTVKRNCENARSFGLRPRRVRLCEFVSSTEQPDRHPRSGSLRVMVSSLEHEYEVPQSRPFASYRYTLLRSTTLRTATGHLSRVRPPARRACRTRNYNPAIVPKDHGGEPTRRRRLDDVGSFCITP